MQYYDYHTNIINTFLQVEKLKEEIINNYILSQNSFKNIEVTDFCPIYNTFEEKIDMLLESLDYYIYSDVITSKPIISRVNIIKNVLLETKYLNEIEELVTKK